MILLSIILTEGNANLTRPIHYCKVYRKIFIPLQGGFPFTQKPKACKVFTGFDSLLSFSNLTSPVMSVRFAPKTLQPFSNHFSVPRTHTSSNLTKNLTVSSSSDLISSYYELRRIFHRVIRMHSKSCKPNNQSKCKVM